MTHTPLFLKLTAQRLSRQQNAPEQIRACVTLIATAIAVQADKSGHARIHVRREEREKKPPLKCPHAMATMSNAAKNQW